MNKDNLSLIVAHVIEGLNWDFIIDCYGPDDHKLKYVVEKVIEKNGKTIKSFEYINPTIELLQQELIELITIVVVKKHQLFYHGHWTIKQISGADMKDQYGDSVEVMFTPCRFTVIEDKKASKRGRKQIQNAPNIKKAFKGRTSNPEKFIHLLNNETNVDILEDMLKFCLDVKTEDYETAGRIHSRLQSLKK